MKEASVPVTVNLYPIKLGQFLKLAAIAEDGVQAKELIGDGRILVNDSPETRRGRQLVKGDSVTVDTVTYICT